MFSLLITLTCGDLEDSYGYKFVLCFNSDLMLNQLMSNCAKWNFEEFAPYLSIWIQCSFTLLIHHILEEISFTFYSATVAAQVHISF